MPSPSPSRFRPSAFTLVEMLVAMLLTLVVLGVALWLFSATQATVRTGLERNSISASVAYFDDHLREDLKGILGPLPMGSGASDPSPPRAGVPSMDMEGGVLVIVPGMREGRLPVVGKGLQSVQKLRCDQMVFLYGVNSPAASPAVGGGARRITSLDPALASLSATQARIWYGHVRRDPAQGGEETDGGTGAQYELAHHWLFGRQAMLMVPPPKDGGYQRGTAGGATQGAVNLLPVKDKDMIVYGYDDTSASGKKLNPLQLLANDLRGLTGTKAPMDPLSSTAPLNQYTGKLGTVDEAYLDLFIPGGKAAHSNNAGADRFHVTSQPVISSQPLADGQLTTGDLFASHLQCVANCSECIIQFAADLDKDGVVDTEPDGSGSRRIVWYPRDAEVFGATAANIPGPFVFRADDFQSRCVHYGYKQDGRAYTNKYGDQFPYPWAPVGTPFSGYYYDMWWNRAWRASERGNGRTFPWPALYSDARSLPDTPTVHGAGSTNFGDGLDAGPGGVGDGVDDPTVIASDSTTALVGNGVPDDELAAYQQLLTDYPQSADAGWRRRVSDWPWMVRIRLRLHDASGSVATRNDDLPLNGRDDDGDGVVDNAPPNDEGRATGYWSEHIFAVPRPRQYK